MIGALVGAGIGALGSIIGGISKARAAKKAKKKTEAAARDNQSWYDRRYNENIMERDDVQGLLTKTRETMAKRNKAAAGKAAVMGGTQAAAAATKEANNDLYAKTMGSIAQSGAAQKAAVENRYLARKNELDDKLAGIEQQRANNTAEAITGVGLAAAGIAGGLDGWESAPNNAGTSAVNGGVPKVDTSELKDLDGYGNELLKKKLNGYY